MVQRLRVAIVLDLDCHVSVMSKWFGKMTLEGLV